jgi:hypothetical protein
MGEFVVQVLKGTPIWVWGILLALLVLGVKQMQPRVVKRYSVLIAPIVFLIIGLMAAGRGMVAFVVWAVALLSLAAFTFLVWKPMARARYDAAVDRLHLPGSPLPMVIMLAIFVLNYVVNVTMAINPALRSVMAWQVIPAILLGALSGVFLGRAATLFRMNRGSFAVAAA